MTRDFEIIFENNYDRDKCIKKLNKITDKEGVKIFNEIEIREKSIFSSDISGKSSLLLFLNLNLLIVTR